jgi:hypothetical protein
MNTIDKVLDKIKEIGWHQGNYVNSDEDGNLIGVCMIGAFRKAELYEWSNWEFANPAFYMPVEEVIKEQFPDRLIYSGMEGIPAFNDHEDTTLDDVLLVLEKASIKYDEMVD